MHYKNGREAKQGDEIIRLPNGSSPAVSGIVHSLNAQSDSCNGRLALVNDNNPYVTLSECLHIDDVAKADIPDSSQSSPGE